MAIAGYHTHALSDVPGDTNAQLVLTWQSREPEIAVTQIYKYTIDVDDKITEAPKRIQRGTLTASGWPVVRLRVISAAMAYPVGERATKAAAEFDFCLNIDRSSSNIVWSRSSAIRGKHCA